MFDFVPIAQYTHYFDLLVLFLVLMAFWQCASGNILKHNVVGFYAGWGFVLAVFLVFYMGMRPISAEFGDTMNYASTFERFKNVPMKWEWGGE